MARSLSRRHARFSFSLRPCFAFAGSLPLSTSTGYGLKLQVYTNAIWLLGGRPSTNGALRRQLYSLRLGSKYRPRASEPIPSVLRLRVRDLVDVWSVLYLHSDPINLGLSAVPSFVFKSATSCPNSITLTAEVTTDGLRTPYGPSTPYAVHPPLLVLVAR